MTFWLSILLALNAESLCYNNICTLIRTDNIKQINCPPRQQLISFFKTLGRNESLSHNDKIVSAIIKSWCTSVFHRPQPKTNTTGSNSRLRWHEFSYKITDPKSSRCVSEVLFSAIKKFLVSRLLPLKISFNSLQN